MSAWRVALLLGAAAAFLCGQTPPATASLHGIVRDASTGVPLADAEVLLLNGAERTEATTDAEGLFAFSGLPVGPTRIRVFHLFLGGNMTQEVNVSADPNAQPVEIHLRTGGHISGRVTDQEGNPIAGVSVEAYKRVYWMGKLQYVRADSGDGNTTPDGQYYIDGLEAGHGYILRAQLDRTRETEPISDEPGDPAERKGIPIPTFYPGADSPALAVPLESNDTRDHIDIRLLRSPPYCVSGAADLPSLGSPDGAHLTLTDRPPSVGVTQTDLGPDGRFRICDLYPGDYSLALNPRGRMGNALGTASITILDGDVDRVTIAPVARGISLTGQVVWDGTPPTLAPDDSALSLWLGAGMLGPAISHRFPIPGPFSLMTPLLSGEVAIQVDQVPPGAYMKQMLYNGAALPGGATIQAGGGTLLITLGTDGARIAARVTDKDGNPVQRANVVISPASPDSESTLAATLRFGTADAQGLWTSSYLAPGRYAVLATGSPPPPGPLSFETVEALWLARGQWQTVDLTPGSTATVTLSPEPLH